jgi:hypothetical protein
MEPCRDSAATVRTLRPALDRAGSDRATLRYARSRRSLCRSTSALALDAALAATAKADDAARIEALDKL